MHSTTVKIVKDPICVAGQHSHSSGLAMGRMTKKRGFGFR